MIIEQHWCKNKFEWQSKENKFDIPIKRHFNNNKIDNGIGKNGSTNNTPRENHKK